MCTVTVCSGALPSSTETGRFIVLPEEKMLCLLFDLGETEDEVHYMFYWSLYEDLRATLFSKMSSISDEFFWMNDYEKH